MNEELRKEVKMLKALKGVPYIKIAEKLGVKRNSFYCWLNN